MSKFQVGDNVKIIAGAKFTNGTIVPQVLVGTDLYVIETKEEGIYRVGQNKNSKRTIGAVHEEDLVSAEVDLENFDPYIILTTMETTTFTAPTFKAGVKQILPKGRLYTVVLEENGYGRLKNNRGWIDLDLVTRLN